MTKGEEHLWRFLRVHALMPRWQPQVPAGKYTLDFYNDHAGLCVEVDGYHHWNVQRQADHDKRRKAYLRKHRILEIRFSNRQVFERTPQVLEEILDAYNQAAYLRTRPDADWYVALGRWR